MNDTEARLRDLLNGRDDFIVSKGLWSEFVGTLSAHPHASDCDKQGEAVKPRVEAQPIKALQMPEYRFQDIDNRTGGMSCGPSDHTTTIKDI